MNRPANIHRIFQSLLFAMGLALSLAAVVAAESADAPVTLTMTSDGRMLLRGQVVSCDEFDKLMQASALSKRTVIVRADPKAPFATVLRVLDRSELDMDDSSLLDAPGPDYRQQRQRSWP